MHLKLLDSRLPDIILSQIFGKNPKFDFFLHGVSEQDSCSSFKKLFPTTIFYVDESMLLKEENKP